MTEEVETEEKEQLSFIKKHAEAIIVGIIIALFVCLINIFVPNILGLNPNRELLIANEDSISLINGDLPSQITSNYFLTNKPTKKIKSLFFKKIAIKNIGNEDGENMPLSIFLKGKNVSLIDNPTIKTKPKEIVDIIKIQKEANSTNTKHIWNITLLKPGETVTFEYMIYSEEKVKPPKINVLARKKSWESKKGVFSDSTTKNSSIVSKVLQLSIGMLIGSAIAVGIFVLIIKVTEKIKEKRA